MKKIFYTLLAIFALVSCKGEFDPVFTGNYGNPVPYRFYTSDDITEIYGEKIISIAELAATYTHGNPKMMDNNSVICGRVSTTDQPGNFYKSFYLQDETGGMEIKIGQNGLYNNFLEGQKVFVRCNDLCIGEYGYKSGSNGMVQIGYKSAEPKYETSYIENKYLIDSHILRGDPADIAKVTPIPMTGSELPSNTATLSSCKNLGRLVKIEGLTYGGEDSYSKEIVETFALLYINSQMDKDSSPNRIFISGKNTGIDRWALTKERMDSCLTSGMWDSYGIGNGNDARDGVYGYVGDRQYKNLYLLDKGNELQAAAIEVLQAAVPAGCIAKINTAYINAGDIVIDDEGKERYKGMEVKHDDVTLKGGETVNLRYVETYPGIERAAYSVSQYFTTPTGNKCVQVRTSGYCKFADKKMNISGKTLTITGILTLYQGNVQITVNRETDLDVK